ncbi:MAG TPA: DUF1080 domain-containing protein [Bacteroidales bacterium]|jgi:hypothetical protein|nr:DUF1080 domain-containing protein [Bacteroidales bacterium]HOS71447.1 DUF1080 domain-containing protein [Bacteroidales bacterium]HQH25057.1 DUF1080 domain-containing protein [Bacteroidales bacterium]HQJ82419.1 DUF1080 domain-containing protein [Bacteroidales bacterium]
MNNRFIGSGIKITAIAISMSMLLISCNTWPGFTGNKTEKINRLTRAEKKQGFMLLFDGKTFNGWRGLGRDHVPAGLWVIEDGMIKKVDTRNKEKLPDGRPVEGGDLMTVETYENFELTFEWKLNKAGNSGVKYNVSEEMSQEYGSGFSALGFEYQLLDDDDESYRGVLKPAQFTGSLYDLIPSRNVALRPVGEFNSSRIIVDGDHAEHWLNGIRVLEYDFGSQELEEAYRDSKFSKIPDFIRKRKAHIVLQNHNDESWFRNIKIRIID